MFFTGIIHFSLKGQRNVLKILDNTDNMNIEISEINIKLKSSLNQEKINTTLGHEFGHGLFDLKNPVLSYIWSNILNENHPKGVAHDKFNPSGHSAAYYESKSR